MKRLIILSTLTLLFLGAWVYGQCGADLVLWNQATAADDPHDPNELGDPNEVPDPNDVEDPNEVDDPRDPGE